MSEVSLFFWSNNLNRYSINALLGALETFKLLSWCKVHFFKNIEEIELSLEKEKIIFCFSFSSFNLLTVKSTIDYLKKKFPTALFLAGGPHPTGDYKGTLDLGFDYVFLGEGEKSFPLFIKNFIEDKDLKNIPGIAFKQKGRLVKNKKELIDFNSYLPFSKQLKRFGPLEITRGCPFACKYCQTSYIFGPKVRHRSLEVLLEWVRFFKQKKLLDFRFITPNALAYGSKDGKEVNLEAIEELLAKVKEIAPQGRIFFGSFPSEVRPEQVSVKSLKVLSRWVDNQNLVIGAQSGSDKILELSGRKHTAGDVLEAVKLARKFNFLPVVDFIFGLPQESWEDEQKSILLMRQIVELGGKVHAHTFIPLPGTPWARKPAGKVSAQMRREMTSLIAKGLGFGNWEAQEKEASRLAKYFQTRKLE